MFDHSRKSTSAPFSRLVRTHEPTSGGDGWCGLSNGLRHSNQGEVMILSLMLASLMNVFVVESPSYAKDMVVAAHELTTQYPDLHFTIRTTEQVIDMRMDDLKRAVGTASVIVLGRTYGDVAAKIQDAFASTGTSPVVFAAHSDFGIYELSRYGGQRPFRNISHEQIDLISAGTLNAKDLPPLA